MLTHLRQCRRCLATTCRQLLLLLQWRRGTLVGPLVEEGDEEERDGAQEQEFGEAPQ